MAGIQLDTQDILVTQHRLLRDVLVDLDLAPCLRERDATVPSDGMSSSELLDCLARIETLEGHLQGLQFHQRVSLESVANLASDHPDRAVNLSFQEFKRLLSATGAGGAGRGAALPDAVVGPDTWFTVAELHGRFLDIHSERAAPYSDDIRGGEFATSMKQWRAGLKSYMEAIREELHVFQAGDRPTAFSVLFDEMREKERTLDGIMRKLLTEYYRGNQYTGRRITEEDGDTAIEVAYHEGPYSGWNARLRVDGNERSVVDLDLEDLYRNEVPSWITVTDECNDEFSRSYEIKLSLKEGNFGGWLEGDGILDFVADRDDTYPARLGVGVIEVCIEYARVEPEDDQVRYSDQVGTRLWIEYDVRSKLVVEVYFRGSDECERETLARERIFYDYGFKVEGLAYPKFGFSRSRRDQYKKLLNSARVDSEWRVREMMKQAIQKIREEDAEMIKKDKHREGRTLSDCHEGYVEAFAYKQQELSEYLKRKLEELESVRTLSRDIALANLHIRSWLSIAFRDLLGQSYLFTALTSGEVAIRTPQEILEEGENCYAWELWRVWRVERDVEDEMEERCRFDRSLKRFENILKSQAMHDVVDYGYGNRVLTDTRFGNLAD